MFDKAYMEDDNKNLNMNWQEKKLRFKPRR